MQFLKQSEKQSTSADAAVECAVVAKAEAVTATMKDRLEDGAYAFSEAVVETDINVESQSCPHMYSNSVIDEQSSLAPWHCVVIGDERGTADHTLEQENAPTVAKDDSIPTTIKMTGKAARLRMYLVIAV